MEYDKNISNDIEKWLDETREQELETLRDQLQQVQQQIKERKKISERTIQDLKDSIYTQTQRLETAERNPEPDEIRVRDRLERLYRDIRNEYSNRWTDIQDLKKEKRELQKEIKLQEKEEFS